MNNNDDIVDRLKERAYACGVQEQGKSAKLFLVAAKHVEALNARIAELEAEVERLRPRAALCEKAWQDIAITGEVDSTTEKAIVAHFEEPTP